VTLRGKQLQVAHAYEQVSAEVERQIVEGTLRPGDQLPGEVEMAEMFGVNRSTVREGIRRLESEGLVRRASPRRLVVSLPRSKDLASRHTRALKLMEITFRELWQVAVATEPLAAELAARSATEEDVARLDENQRRMAHVVETGESPVELDTAFHILVADCTRNRVLKLAHEPIAFLLFPGLEALIPHLPQAPGRQLVAHQKVIDAIRLGDADTARDWMHRHLVDFRRGYEIANLPLDAPIVPLAANKATS